MYEIKEVKYTNKDFINLCKMIDEYQNNLIKQRKNWGFSSLDNIKYLEKILLMYYNKEPISCAAIRKIDNYTAELRSVYTKVSYRNMGISKILINKLIKYLRDTNCNKIILYTLVGSNSAIHLYKKLGFKEVLIKERQDNLDYMGYIDDDISKEIDKYTIYMEKTLT